MIFKNLLQLKKLLKCLLKPSYHSGRKTINFLGEHIVKRDALIIIKFVWIYSIPNLPIKRYILKECTQFINYKNHKTAYVMLSTFLVFVYLVEKKNTPNFNAKIKIKEKNKFFYYFKLNSFSWRFETQPK